MDPHSPYVDKCDMECRLVGPALSTGLYRLDCVNCRFASWLCRPQLGRHAWRRDRQTGCYDAVGTREPRRRNPAGSRPRRLSRRVASNLTGPGEEEPLAESDDPDRQRVFSPFDALIARSRATCQDRGDRQMASTDAAIGAVRVRPWGRGRRSQALAGLLEVCGIDTSCRSRRGRSRSRRACVRLNVAR